MQKGIYYSVDCTDPKNDWVGGHDGGYKFYSSTCCNCAWFFRIITRKEHWDDTLEFLTSKPTFSLPMELIEGFK